MNKKILILYDYFDPAYKAGGPIRSLVNLVKLMENDMDIFVLTTNRDHDGTILNVMPNTWKSYGEKTMVKYLPKERVGYSSIKNTIDDVNPDIVYLNGIYSLPFLVFPLTILKKRKNIQVVLAPRGMLQSHSLSIKSWKKKIYLAILKLLFLHNHIRWKFLFAGKSRYVAQQVDVLFIT